MKTALTYEQAKQKIEELGLKQSVLAKKLNISPSHFSRVLQGKCKSDSILLLLTYLLDEYSSGKYHE
jgi:predicted XRE-type DNA-binding protein